MNLPSGLPPLLTCLMRLNFLYAWAASLSYTFQIYFDFSGYTDMAIGAALMFNIRLPINFNSPYKALDIQDFWRRWHITLSRFLRDYIYIPLGGNRVREGHLLLNLMITFLIGGIWHGAGWTFVYLGASPRSGYRHSSSMEDDQYQASKGNRMGPHLQFCQYSMGIFSGQNME